MNKEIKDLITEVQKTLSDFIKHNITALNDNDCWNDRVLAVLSEQQRRIIRERKITKIEELDLAALLSVLTRNWFDLRNTLSLHPTGKTLAHEIWEIRNRLAHESLIEPPVEDLYRDVDTICRFLEFLGADASQLHIAETTRANLIAQLAKGIKDSPEEFPRKIQDQDESSKPPSSPESNDAIEIDESSDTTDSTGVPTETFEGGSPNQSVEKALEYGTYVGIDFGTSTTVVSIVRPETNGNGFTTEPMKIKQKSSTGADIEDHIVPSCIAWHENQLYVGRGAEFLKQQKQKDKNIWTSFKMGMGINLGPTYPRTELPGDITEYKITTPQEAALVFFKFLKERIEDYCSSSGLSDKIFYAVSVPAGFEANQRQDLVSILLKAGLSESSVLIDEPNAAFLSFLSQLTYGSASESFLRKASVKPQNILVYDFGAGTCDISILQISSDKKTIRSKNLALSRFMALGGDDIDLTIAEQILLPQLCKNKDPAECFTSRELEDVALKTLKYVAENLKISCCKILEQQNIRSAEAKQLDSERPIEGNPMKPFTASGKTWELNNPSISLRQFRVIMKEFFANNEHEKSLVSPIIDALSKAKLSKDELDMTLFVGGSAQNTLVQGCVESHLGRFVEHIVPPDLRSLVSQGAAIHSFLVSGLGLSLIQPITSETIYVVTKDEVLEPILTAGTKVPSPELMISRFEVARDNQETVDLPICVGEIGRIIGMLTLRRDTPGAFFSLGDQISVSCHITKDKLIKVRASFGNDDRNETVSAAFSGSGAAFSSGRQESQRLMAARQALNESILSGSDSRPSLAALINFEDAARNEGLWQQAAEAAIAVERLDTSRNRATTVAYCYSRCGLHDKTDHWSTEAYARSKNEVTSYNFALVKDRAGDERGYQKLLEEALQYNPQYYSAKLALGNLLRKRGDVRGVEILTEICDSLEQEMDVHGLDQDETRIMNRAASLIGRDDLVNKASTLGGKDSNTEKSLYERDNLVKSKSGPKLDS